MPNRPFIEIKPNGCELRHCRHRRGTLQVCMLRSNEEESTKLMLKRGSSFSLFGCHIGLRDLAGGR
eukprot:scaffold648047_cov41-Prasinocladus_malaysianus.AAC.1